MEVEAQADFLSLLASFPTPPTRTIIVCESEEDISEDDEFFSLLSSFPQLPTRDVVSGVLAPTIPTIIIEDMESEDSEDEESLPATPRQGHAQLWNSSYLKPEAF